MIRGIDAVPTCAWLNPASPGEQDPIELLELMRSKGIGAVNIIPDRNWNIKNAEEKAVKLPKPQSDGPSMPEGSTCRYWWGRR